jgi:hypothetical protein
MGEARRRKLAGTYPKSTSGESVTDFAEFSQRLRRLLPKISDTDIGLAWMRAEGAGVTVPSGEPEAYPVREGHVVLHIILGSAILSGALPVADLDAAIGRWKQADITRQQLGEGYAQAHPELLGALL